MNKAVLYRGFRQKQKRNDRLSKTLGKCPILSQVSSFSTSGGHRGRLCSWTAGWRSY